jgi:hypothetical protein
LGFNFDESEHRLESTKIITGFGKEKENKLKLYRCETKVAVKEGLIFNSAVTDISLAGAPIIEREGEEYYAIGISNGMGSSVKERATGIQFNAKILGKIC